MRVKALIVKPPLRGDWDFGDVLAVARSESLVLRWVGLSAEVIGSELEVQVDYVNFYTI